jgi:hypothetical protein
MFTPWISAALAEQHRADLQRQSDRYGRTRAARTGRHTRHTMRALHVPISLRRTSRRPAVAEGLVAARSADCCPAA